MSDNESRLPQVQRERALVTNEEALFDTAKFDQIARVAGVMGKSSLIPDHLRVMRDREGNLVVNKDQVPAYVDVEATTANCFLIVNQARLFGGIDPFALAQLSYFVHGRLGFEGKLIQAVIERRTGALRFEYFGDPGTIQYGITVTGWVPGADPARQESISGTVDEWQTKDRGGNPLSQWKGKSGQTRQLHYRGTREWGRMYAPGLVLGLLDEDDLDAIRENHRAERARPVNGPAAAQTITQVGAQPARYNPLMDAEADAEDTSTEAVPSPAHARANEEAQPDNGRDHPPATAPTGSSPAGGAPAAPAPRRAPRGAPARVDRLEMSLGEAKTAAAVMEVWNRDCEAFFREMEPTGWDFSAARDRLLEARQVRIAMIEGANPKTGEVVAGPDLSAVLTEFSKVAGEATTFEGLDEALDRLVNPHQWPVALEAKVDEVLDRERKRVSDLRKADSEPAPQEQSAPAPDGDAFPGDEALAKFDQTKVEPMTEEELQDTVDGWISEMRKCKTLEDLTAFNTSVITEFYNGPHAEEMSKDQTDDARQTYENRRRLLMARTTPNN